MRIICIAIGICLGLAPLSLVLKAAETPAIDFTQSLLTLDGKPAKASTEKDAPALTLSDVAVNSLEATVESDRGLSGEKKFAMDALARKLYKNSHCVLSVEDLALLKSRIGIVYGPMVVGDAYRLLDPSVK